MSEEHKGFEGWCLLELFGHRKLAGHLSEVEIAGAGMLRLDIPNMGLGTYATQYYNPSAVYGVTPTTEETARRLGAVRFDPPVERWELPSAAREPAVDHAREEPFDYEDEDDEEDTPL